MFQVRGYESEKLFKICLSLAQDSYEDLLYF